VPSGSKTVSPPQTTSYTLTCISPQGTNFSTSTTVTVNNVHIHVEEVNP
jgi:hypothetical protein